MWVHDEHVGKTLLLNDGMREMRKYSLITSFGGHTLFQVAPKYIVMKNDIAPIDVWAKAHRTFYHWFLRFATCARMRSSTVENKRLRYREMACASRTNRNFYNIPNRLMISPRLLYWCAFVLIAVAISLILLPWHGDARLTLCSGVMPRDFVSIRFFDKSRFSGRRLRLQALHSSC